MIQAIPDVLARIAEVKRQDELPPVLASLPALERRAEASLAGRRDFRQALLTHTPAIIAEFKKASPSKGLFAPRADPDTVARAYEQGGAAALSVLTDRQFFSGSFADLRAARQATSLPALRKDFIIHPAQVVEAAAEGADAILLIAALLSVAEMKNLHEVASRYRLAVLVEAHDRAELDAALEAGSRIVGVNNRNLRTFEVSLAVSLELAPYIPRDVIRVSESGIRTAEDVQTLRTAGFQAFLVGEHLMTSSDPASNLRVLTQELPGGEAAVR
jgi:indole-3-glycerol phosphate synthase